jgi:hypothetical protein
MPRKFRGAASMFQVRNGSAERFRTSDGTAESLHLDFLLQSFGPLFNAMTPAEVLQQLRRFLLVLAVILFAGALVELWLVGHTEDWIQWIPFVLSIAGSIAALIVLLRTSAATVRLLRVGMVIIVLGTLFGIYQHIAGNIAFAREVDRNASTEKLIRRGLDGGNPLLAPGILAVAAVLGLGATYKYEVTRQD